MFREHKPTSRSDLRLPLQYSYLHLFFVGRLEAGSCAQRGTSTVLCTSI